ncbi:MAG: hypothetical protein Q8869_03380, partial [Candidatus Phytoplasma australasiaticum]|nr:hypothetical protein [Candidatus Phytoplasma australasiaticum]
MADVSEELIEKQDKPDITASVPNGDDFDTAKNGPTAESTVSSSEHHDNQQQLQNHLDDFISGGVSSGGQAFESEDYPSIVEKEQSSPIKENHHHFGASGDVFENGTSNIT